MNSTPRITLSAAAFTLICFFLPWMQVSCMGMRDSVSGLDLARSGDRTLWLLPVFMAVVLLTGVVRFIWERLPFLFALTSIVSGGLSAYLMYRERLTSGQSSGLIAAQMTPWFWLGLVAAAAVAAAGLMFYVRRSRSP